MALPVQARTETIENGVKTVRLTWTVDTDSGADRPRIALGRTADALVLVAADKQDREERFDEAYLSSLSVLVNQDPYPGFTMSGKQMIWVKDYSENKGIVPQLERAGFLRLVGSKIKQGLVELPLAEVTLDDTEMIQQCAKCGQWETSDTSPRYKRCSKCKRRYYCSAEHQHEDWSTHRADCKDLVKMRFADVENRRREAGWNPTNTSKIADPEEA
ncbi:hypothetical protein BMF94_0885 [Rhodotorula taiwanensis]|uniref:MYND-type domain-containing protein n=1 Tax=Rhodotorula taiwanensis TaxID=741276 RepID=A0A2S5BHC3_9BASI|nr:hypothetical protein BMF94_0885 [Rhodotorula taiwanensis]